MSETLSDPAAVITGLLAEDPAGTRRAIAEQLGGWMEQRVANEQVRQMRRSGYCPTCGAEER